MMHLNESAETGRRDCSSRRPDGGLDESLSIEDIAKVATVGAQYIAHSGFVTKRDYVVSAVRDMISTGELKPGDHLRQDDLAERLNVSSTPLREAMLLLKAEGLLAY